MIPGLQKVIIMIPGLISTGVDIVSGLFSDDKQKKSPTNTGNAGVSGAMSGESTNPAPEVKIEGSMAKKYGQELLDGAITQGIESVLGNRPSAEEMGKEQREYMDAAHPNLNEWEQAGAQAAGAASDATGAAIQASQANKQLKAQERMNRENNKTTEAVAGINSATQLQTNKNTIDSQAELVAAQTASTTQNIQNLQAQLGTSHAQTKQLLQLARNAEFQTKHGKTYQDIDMAIDKMGLGDKKEQAKKWIGGLLNQGADKATKYAEKAYQGIKSSFNSRVK